MNMEKSTIMRISRQPSLIQIIIHKKTEEYAILQHLDSMITNDARCTCIIHFRIGGKKAAFNRNTFPPANGA